MSKHAHIKRLLKENKVAQKQAWERNQGALLRTLFVAEDELKKQLAKAKKRK